MSAVRFRPPAPLPRGLPVGLSKRTVSGAALPPDRVAGPRRAARPGGRGRAGPRSSRVPVGPGSGDGIRRFRPADLPSSRRPGPLPAESPANLRRVAAGRGSARRCRGGVAALDSNGRPICPAAGSGSAFPDGVRRFSGGRSGVPAPGAAPRRVVAGSPADPRPRRRPRRGTAPLGRIGRAGLRGRPIGSGCFEPRLPGRRSPVPADGRGVVPGSPAAPPGGCAAGR